MQLALDIALQQDASFDNFCWQGNEVLEQQIKASLEDKKECFYYLWAKAGSGKSHLLQAITHAFEHNAAYIPLQQVCEYGAEVLDGLDNLSLICLDDLDSIAGSRAFEEALFHLYNKLRDDGDKLLFMTGSRPLGELSLSLPDLHSRLSWGLIFQLQSLDEEHKAQVLVERASQKGLSLPANVADYLLSHCSRNMSGLIEVLDTLDKASLAAKRKLTIPFVKRVLGL